ncbi:MAG: hypothetical protein ABR599_07725 [Gemmatimonadota bacterium]
MTQSVDGASPPVVVKVGGSLARDPPALRRLMEALAATRPSPVIVPGGGALADAVRSLHGRGELTEATAHAMALLALDQVALWLCELAGGAPGRVLPARGSDPDPAPASAAIVRSREEVERALAADVLPVLAPFDWLSREGPLPASWRVTSDSIAAWLAARLGSRSLVLMKSFAFRESEVCPEDLGDAVDPFFLEALPPAVEVTFVDARDPGRAARALAGVTGAGTRLRARGALG